MKRTKNEEYLKDEKYWKIFLRGKKQIKITEKRKLREEKNHVVITYFRCTLK